MTALEREVRALKLYAIAATLLGAGFLLAFRQQLASREFDEVKARRFLVVDAEGRGRVMMASNYKPDSSAGVYFFNRQGTEAGVLSYDGKRGEDGQANAYAVWTMDEFQDDEVVRIAMEQSARGKRKYFVITARPDSLTPRAQQWLRDRQAALASATTDEERRTIRREFSTRIPGREIWASRLWVGEEYDGTSLVRLNDRDGHTRLQLRVDASGNASIAFLDAEGRTVRELKP